MKWSILAVALIVAAGPAGVSAAGTSEHWQAYSKTATAITGDIDLSPTYLRAGRATFRLKVAADSPHFANETQASAARVLAVLRPANPVLLNGNTICGRNPVRWIAVWRVHGDMLALAAYSDRAMPTQEDSPGACGSFYYSR